MALRKKICLLFAGGTIYPDNQGKWQVVKKESDINKWLSELPELRIVGEIEPVFLYGEDTGPITSQHWQVIAKAIIERYKHYDGFVLLHGLESFIYSAAAISLAFANLSKPIVITGSPLSHKKNERLADKAFKKYKSVGVRANLLNATQVALADVAETMALYGNGIFRAGALIRTGSEGNIIDSYADGKIGHIDFGIRFSGKVTVRSNRKLGYHAHYNPQVHMIEYHPGLSDDWLARQGRSIKGLIITVKTIDELSAKFRKQLLAVKRRGIIPVLYDRQARSSDDRQFLIVNDMTLEMTLVKLMWSLGQSKDYAKVSKLMRLPVAHEKINLKNV
ncbi:MAG: asparaginase domain-containing protein [Patescibacteria group bacterium]